MYVYLITNTVNGKMYVGQTIQDVQRYWEYNKRCAESGKNHKPALYAAIRKYGRDSFRIHVLCSASSKAEMDSLEKLAILSFGTKTKDHGYNLTDGGDGTVGAERTEEWKRNISKGNTGKTWDDDRRLRSSISRRGKVLSEAHKCRIGDGVRGKAKPKEWVEKLIARNTARAGEKRRPRTPEHKANLVASRMANRAKRLEAECLT